jgi:outer membrane protein assembly factor BamE (lipoprotein component of BamABCDE complex)
MWRQNITRVIWIKAILGTLVLSLALLNGCSFNRGTWGDEFRNEDIQLIKKGDRRADVIEILGAPDRIVEVNGHEVLQYYRYEIRVMAFAPLIAMARTYIVSDDLYVFLNKDALVNDLVFGKRTNKQEFQFWPWGD